MKKILIISLSGLILLSTAILFVFKNNTDRHIFIDGEKYLLGVKLSYYLKEFKVDYTLSGLKEGYTLKADKQDDFEIFLSSARYPCGFSVIISNGTNQNLEICDCTVSSLIIDTSDMIDKPDIGIPKYFKWGINQSKAKQLYGKTEFEDISEEFTIIRFKKYSGINFYFNRKDELNRILFFG